MKQKKIRRSIKGITLIALVITIIVLLILAGVSIAMLTGENGILTQAQNAKKETSVAEEKEQIALAYNAAIAKKQSTDITEKELNAELEANEAGANAIKDGENIKVTFEESKREYIIDKNGNITTEGGSGTVTPPETSPEIDEETGLFKQTSTIDGSEPGANNPTIPEGFKPIETETSSWGDGKNPPLSTDVNNGLVIQDSVGNEFVWIPVETPVSQSEAEGTNNKAMAIQQADGNYRGLLYDFNENDSAVRSECTTTIYEYREPAFLTDSECDNSTSNVDVEGEKIVTEVGLQGEYNNMIESVKTYHGFYVGRYELGLDESDNPTSRKAGNGVTTADAGSSSLENWYGLYSKSKQYAPEGTKSVVSSMIWGSQFDAMLNWMQKNGENVYLGDSSKTNESYDTGSGTNDVVKNVFDLYGCHYEWTLEANDSIYRVGRGGISGNDLALSGRYTILSPSDSTSYDLLPYLSIRDGSTHLTLYIVLDTE